MSNFLAETRHIEKLKVKTLIIDECAMSDSNFAKILKGIEK